jgi:hypothetical protein
MTEAEMFAAVAKASWTPAPDLERVKVPVGGGRLQWRIVCKRPLPVLLVESPI